MNTHRLAIALISAAFAFAASSTASATVYNLNTLVTVPIDTVDGRAFFTTDFSKTSGTGVIDPFLSIQANPTESGYNISSGVLDTKRNGQYTVTQHVSDLQTIVVNGVSYYAFLIDINESNSAANSKISIDTIKIYTSNNLLTTFGDLTSQGTLQFDIDSLDPNVTLLYDDLNTGSGQGDVAFFVPTSILTGVSSTDFFYLYQEFGVTGGAFASDSGFEETRHGGDLTFVPIPETNALMPILAVLGVVVAGPLIRRCFHP
jgi:hypothetical protein